MGNCLGKKTAPPSTGDDFTDIKGKQNGDNTTKAKKKDRYTEDPVETLKRQSSQPDTNKSNSKYFHLYYPFAKRVMSIHVD